MFTFKVDVDITYLWGKLQVFILVNKGGWYTWWDEGEMDKDVAELSGKLGIVYVLHKFNGDVKKRVWYYNISFGMYLAMRAVVRRVWQNSSTLGFGEAKQVYVAPD